MSVRERFMFRHGDRIVFKLPPPSPETYRIYYWLHERLKVYWMMNYIGDFRTEVVDDGVEYSFTVVRGDRFRQVYGCAFWAHRKVCEKMGVVQ
ncbi:MAG: hypothetical protein QXO47_09750 [Thermoproteota archaeon]